MKLIGLEHSVILRFQLIGLRLIITNEKQKWKRYALILAGLVMMPS